MTLTIELKPEVENLLRQVARERGVALEDVIAQRLNFSEADLEELEDELDLAAMRRAREASDPNDRKTLDDLRAAMAAKGSSLDVEGIDLGVSSEEIVDFVRAGSERL